MWGSVPVELLKHTPGKVDELLDYIVLQGKSVTSVLEFAMYQCHLKEAIGTIA